MVTFRKLIVEVVGGRNLLPKDGQRKRTKTVVRDLNPTWNEVLDFNMAGGGFGVVWGHP